MSIIPPSDSTQHNTSISKVTKDIQLPVEILDHIFVFSGCRTGRPLSLAPKVQSCPLSWIPPRWRHWRWRTDSECWANYIFDPDRVSKLVSEDPHILHQVQILQIQIGLTSLDNFASTLLMFPVFIMLIAPKTMHGVYFLHGLFLRCIGRAQTLSYKDMARLVQEGVLVIHSETSPECVYGDWDLVATFKANHRNVFGCYRRWTDHLLDTDSPALHFGKSCLRAGVAQGCASSSSPSSRWHEVQGRHLWYIYEWTLSQPFLGAFADHLQTRTLPIASVASGPEWSLFVFRPYYSHSMAMSLLPLTCLVSVMTYVLWGLSVSPTLGRLPLLSLSWPHFDKRDHMICL